MNCDPDAALAWRAEVREAFARLRELHEKERADGLTDAERAERARLREVADTPFHVWMSRRLAANNGDRPPAFRRAAATLTGAGGRVPGGT
jgi:hypothetical protein